MLEYLTQYGLSAQNLEFSEVDINDRMALENQINFFRKKEFETLKLIDSIQARQLEIMSSIRSIVKNAKLGNTAKSVNSILSVDDEYLELESEEEALKMGLSMANNVLSTIRNDLRILNSVFYNKF